MLLAADRACFVAKRSGRDRIATAAEGLALAAEFSLQAPTPVDPPSRPDRLTARNDGSVTAREDRVTDGRRRSARPVAPLPRSCSRRSSTACVPTPAEPCQSGRPVRPRRSPTPHADARRPTTDAPPFVRPTPTPVPTFALYTVKRGDTLVGIAKRFETDGREHRLLEPGDVPVARPGVGQVPAGPHRGRLGPADPAGRDRRSRGDPELTPRPTPRPTLPTAVDGPSPAAWPDATPPARRGRRWSGLALILLSVDRTAASTRIVVTVADPAPARRPDSPIARTRSIPPRSGAGGDPILVTTATPAAERAAALASMDGLLLSGGADVDPARYGRASQGAVAIEPERDALEARGMDRRERPGRADPRRLPRMQAINVFSGGTLVQNVEGHAGPGWGIGPAATHPLRLRAGQPAGPDPVPDQRRGGS